MAIRNQFLKTDTVGYRRSNTFSFVRLFLLQFMEFDSVSLSGVRKFYDGEQCDRAVIVWCSGLESSLRYFTMTRRQSKLSTDASLESAQTPTLLHCWPQATADEH